jgi:hypothetical protein
MNPKDLFESPRLEMIKSPSFFWLPNNPEIPLE